MRSLIADLLVLRKRNSTWVLLGVWVLLGMTFAYLLPYVTYRSVGLGAGEELLPILLPENLLANTLALFPVYGGVFALMLGILAVGSDYGWGTIKTVLSQRSGRLRVLASKLAAIYVVLVAFVLAMFIAGAIGAYAIASIEGAIVSWPTAPDLVEALSAGWFLFAIWAAMGVGLAVLSKGTGLAIGLGILYALILESILAALADQVSWLTGLVEYSLRANAYSIVTAIGVPASVLGDNGPGGFFGPFVDATQATVVLCAYAAFSMVLAGVVFVRRDVG
jgi:ABC-type transport system involved in multi-copper enzyme maturation permease subunit